MNDFEYLIKAEELSKMKTKKAKEELIRSCYTAVTGITYAKSWYSLNITSLEVFNSYANYYKIISVAIDSYGKGLPGFLVNFKDALFSKLNTYLIENKIPYKNWVSFMEVSKVTDCGSLWKEEEFINIITCVGTNIPPFKIDFKPRVPEVYTEVGANNARLLYYEAMRHKLGYQPYTYLDNLIAAEYLQVQEISTLKDTMTLLNTVATTITANIDG